MRNAIGRIILNGVSKLSKTASATKAEQAAILHFAESPISHISIPKGSMAAPRFKAVVNDLTGEISLYSEQGSLVGDVAMSQLVKSKKTGILSLKFDGLNSYQQGSGVGTQLIEELVKLSNSLGAEGRLVATASPLRMVNGRFTNLGFYYKMGFRAVDESKHLEIQKLLDEGKEIPLGVNAMTDIYLTPDGIQKALKSLDKVS